MTDRIKEFFSLVCAHAARRLPWLRHTRLKACQDADRAHRRTWRLFMHSNHQRMIVCAARAAERELTDAELVGMIAHEMGHIVGEELGFPEHARNPGTPWRTQAEADWIARRVLGFRLRYNDRTLQEVY